MMKSFRRRSAVAVLAVFAMACSDSTGPKSSLDQTVAMEVYAELTAAIGEALAGASFGRPEVSMGDSRIASAMDSFEETVPCEQGGSITVSGTYTNNTSQNGTGTISGSFTESFSNCQLVISKGPVTVQGDPNLKGTVSEQLSSWNLVNGTMEMTGAFRVSGAASGRCAIDLSVQYGSSGPGLPSGSICGQSIGN